MEERPPRELEPMTWVVPRPRLNHYTKFLFYALIDIYIYIYYALIDIYIYIYMLLCFNWYGYIHMLVQRYKVVINM